MAKDGTARGGQRVGAGRKSKALTDKIADGRLNGALVLPEPTDIEGADVPAVKDYLKATQKNGKDLCAEDIYIETYKWLKDRSCEMLVNNQLIEQYAETVAGFGDAFPGNFLALRAEGLGERRTVIRIFWIAKLAGKPPALVKPLLERHIRIHFFHRIPGHQLLYFGVE